MAVDRVGRKTDRRGRPSPHNRSGVIPRSRRVAMRVAAGAISRNGDRRRRRRAENDRSRRGGKIEGRLINRWRAAERRSAPRRTCVTPSSASSRTTANW
jgi:hypothetical protein